MYWGKYVAHDNNRDGMGQYSEAHAEYHQQRARMHPTILHDLHEGPILFIPCPPAPVVQYFARSHRHQRMVAARRNRSHEMAKRGVPGVFTYGFYDGWVPNYLFLDCADPQFFRPLLRSCRATARTSMKICASSRPPPAGEWYRPNPPLPSIKWGPRNNTNIQDRPSCSR